MALTRAESNLSRRCLALALRVAGPRVDDSMMREAANCATLQRINAKTTAGRTRSVERVLLLLSFAESFGTVLLERGFYFFTTRDLRATAVQNLWFALSFGACYAAGASSSHRAALRFGERRVLRASLGALFCCHALLAVVVTPRVLWVVYPLIGLLQGLKWPVVESYVTAGRSPTATVRVLGRFNVAWAIAVPIAIGSAGPLISFGWSPLLFVLPALANLYALVLTRALSRGPAHSSKLSTTFSTEFDPLLYRRLLGAVRWVMLASYASLFLIAPLVPERFFGLGLNVEHAAMAASLLDAVRVLTFAVLGLTVSWRGKALPIALSLLALPAGFLAVLFAKQLMWVLVGELLFGLGAGFTYSAALYYAVILGNASVEAGGAHESLIGAGFVLGPIAGLVGIALSRFTAAGEWLAVTPLLSICSLAAAKALWPGRAATRV